MIHVQIDSPLTAPARDEEQSAANALATLENISDICAGRDKAISHWMATYDNLHDGLELAHRASIAGIIGLTPPDGNRGYGTDRLTRRFLAAGEVEVWEGEGYDRKRVKRDARDRFLEELTTTVDRKCWSEMMERLGFDNLLDRQAREEFAASLRDKPPTFNVENCTATFTHVWGQRREMYLRGIANVFMNLDRRFRSHDAFAIGNRIVFDRALGTDYSSWSSYTSRDAIDDVERIFRELDELPPLDGRQRVSSRIACSPSQRPQMIEEAYFNVRSFKNGNVHLWFTRKDLLKQVNELLLEYYKPVEGDVSETGPSYENGPQAHQTPAKHYGFFPSPPEVVEALLRDAPMHGREDCCGSARENWQPRRILEPSAGTGAIAKAARAKGHDVTCVEIQPHLAALLRSERFTTHEADFIQTQPAELGLFDVILMNPPFDRGRDCDHVLHAYEFLKPGGVLVAVMSARAEHCQDARHKPLHDLVASGRNKWGGGSVGRWRDLPERSFAAAGTNVNTVTLTLQKPRA